jgi:hypothetical protein
MAANSPPRAYSAAHFGLELDGSKKSVGFFRSIDGGGVSAEVINYQFGDSKPHEIWRQLGKPKYEDFKIQTGMSMSFEFYAWIAQFFDGVVVRKSGAIVACDFYWKEQARREFHDAMITDLAFPKLDGSDKGPAYMTVTIAPERMVFMKGSGQVLQSVTDWQRQQLWTAANFTFTLDGFDDVLARVTKIDGFSIKQKAIDVHVSEQRHPIKVPGRIEWPNIVFYMPEVDAQPLIEDFMKQARDGEPLSPGRQGSIVVHDNAKGDLFELTLTNCHIKSAIPDKSDATSEEIKLVKFEMGVEAMKFHWPEEPM